MGVSKDPSCSGKGRNRYGFVLCRIRLFQQHYRAWDVPAWLYGRCRRLSNHPLFSRTQILIAFPTECFSCLSGIFFCQRVKFIRLFEPNARGGVTNFLATDIRKQVMRRVDNSMHRKSRRLLKNIVILSIENPQSHTDNARKYGAQKIADTLCTRMLGKSPVCQNSGVGKKGEMLESCQHHQQRGKKQISNRRQRNSFQPMFFARLPTRTHEH